MVDSIKNAVASGTLIRAQALDIAALRSGQRATQTIINQLANGAKPTTVQPSIKSAGASKGNLPRGSLVDTLA